LLELGRIRLVVVEYECSARSRIVVGLKGKS
jgi:hypothetical protein